MGPDSPNRATEELESAIDERRLVETLRELICLRSENPFRESPSAYQGEKAVAQYMFGRLSSLGVECELRELAPRRTNLVARLGSGTSSLMLAGHMDTVSSVGYPEAYSAEEKEGFIHGRGACDMKGALACYMEVAEVLSSKRPSLGGAMYLVGVADEEYAMRGARAIGEGGPIADGVIVGEPTGLGVCPASKGRVTTSIITRGLAAHSSTPETGTNAIVHMGRILSGLQEYASDLLSTGENHPLLGRPRLNPAIITGGIQANIVPEECRLEVDRRTLPDESSEDVYGELEALLAEARKEVPELQAELTEPGLIVPANEVESEEPVVVALRASAGEVLGEQQGLSGFTAGSDAAYYGSPAVICGPGSIQQAHTTDEFVAVEDLMLATRMYLRTVMRMLGEVN